MSAEKTGEKKGKRRRRRTRDEENVEAVDALEAEAQEADDDEETRGLSERKGRATPSRRKQVDTAGVSRGNLVVRVGRGAVDYFEGVYAEIKKVSWPTREEAYRLTMIVVVTTVASAIVLGGLSFLYTELFRIGLGTPIVLGGALLVLVVLSAAYLFYGNRD